MFQELYQYFKFNFTLFERPLNTIKKEAADSQKVKKLR